MSGTKSLPRMLSVEPHDFEQAVLDQLVDLFQPRMTEAEEGSVRPTVSLVVGDEELVLPAVLIEVLEQAARLLASGQTVYFMGANTELRTGEAAKLLNVSRQYVVRLCDEGKIPYTLEGAHRRLALQDVLAYRRERDEVRRAKFREMVAAAAAAGEYDLPITWPPEG